MALISVIVPVYNVEQYLKRCVDSILAQTFSDFELILVDDGSPDNCGKICDEYASRDKRIHVIHQENSGLSVARNVALDWIFKCSNRSEYISFIDSDDWVHTRYLELLLKAIKEFDAEISQCMMKRTDTIVQDRKLEERMLCVTPEQQYSEWYSPFACGKLYRKELFSSLRYPIGILFEDVSIWYKLLFSLSKIAIVDAELYYYFQREEGITNSTWIPAKLAQIKAWDEQISFAKTMNSLPVLHTALKRGCWVYKHQYEEIESSNRISEKEKKRYKRKVMHKLRTIVFLYRKELNDIGIYQKYFKYAYPKLNWLKRTAIGVIGKFRK